MTLSVGQVFDADDFTFKILGSSSVSFGDSSNNNANGFQRNTEYSKPVVIPNTVSKNGVHFKVIEIGTNAVSFMNKITSILIGKSIQVIRGSAFEECYSVSSIVFESNSECYKLCRNAFSLTSFSFNEIKLPPSIIEIESYSIHDVRGFLHITYCGTTDFSTVNYGYNSITTCFVTSKYPYGNFFGMKPSIFDESSCKFSSVISPTKFFPISLHQRLIIPKYYVKSLLFAIPLWQIET